MRFHSISRTDNIELDHTACKVDGSVKTKSITRNIKLKDMDLKEIFVTGASTLVYGVAKIAEAESSIPFLGTFGKIVSALIDNAKQAGENDENVIEAARQAEAIQKLLAEIDLEEEIYRGNLWREEETDDP